MPGVSLTLRARAWPVGEAQVHIRLEPAGAETEVRIDGEGRLGAGRLRAATDARA